MEDAIKVRESIEFKKLIPEHIDVLFDVSGNPICSRQAISNHIQKEVAVAIDNKTQSGTHQIEIAVLTLAGAIESGRIEGVVDEIEAIITNH